MDWKAWLTVFNFGMALFLAFLRFWEFWEARKEKREKKANAPIEAAKQERQKRMDDFRQRLEEAAMNNPWIKNPALLALVAGAALLPNDDEVLDAFNMVKAVTGKDPFTFVDKSGNTLAVFTKAPRPFSHYVKQLTYYNNSNNGVCKFNNFPEIANQVQEVAQPK